MFKKNVLLAALVSLTASLGAVSTWDAPLQGAVRRSLAGDIELCEKIIFDLEQQIEKISFLEWVVSLEESVERPYTILIDEDNHMTVFFDEECRFSFKYSGYEFSQAVMLAIAACQGSISRKETAAMTIRNAHVKRDLERELAGVQQTQVYLKEVREKVKNV